MLGRLPAKPRLRGVAPQTSSAHTGRLKRKHHRVRRTRSAPPRWHVHLLAARRSPPPLRSSIAHRRQHRRRAVTRPPLRARRINAARRTRSALPHAAVLHLARTASRALERSARMAALLHHNGDQLA